MTFNEISLQTNVVDVILEDGTTLDAKIVELENHKHGLSDPELYLDLPAKTNNEPYTWSEIMNKYCDAKDRKILKFISAPMVNYGNFTDAAPESSFDGLVISKKNASIYTYSINYNLNNRIKLDLGYGNPSTLYKMSIEGRRNKDYNLDNIDFESYMHPFSQNGSINSDHSTQQWNEILAGSKFAIKIVSRVGNSDNLPWAMDYSTGIMFKSMNYNHTFGDNQISIFMSSYGKNRGVVFGSGDSNKCRYSFKIVGENESVYDFTLYERAFLDINDTLNTQDLYIDTIKTKLNQIENDAIIITLNHEDDDWEFINYEDFKDKNTFHIIDCDSYMIPEWALRKSSGILFGKKIKSGLFISNYDSNKTSIKFLNKSSDNLNATYLTLTGSNSINYNLDSFNKISQIKNDNIFINIKSAEDTWESIITNDLRNNNTLHILDGNSLFTEIGEWSLKKSTSIIFGKNVKSGIVISQYDKNKPTVKFFSKYYLDDSFSYFTITGANGTEYDLNTINRSITQLNTKDTSHDESIKELNVSISSNQKSIQTHSVRLSELDTKISSHDTSIAELNTKATSHDTSIAEVNTKISSHDTSIAELNKKTTSHDTSIETVKSKINQIKNDNIFVNAKTSEDTWDSIITNNLKNKDTFHILNGDTFTEIGDWSLKRSTGIVFGNTIKSGIIVSRYDETKPMVKFFSKSYLYDDFSYFTLTGASGVKYDLDSVDTGLTGKMYWNITNENYDFTWKDLINGIKADSGKGSLKFVTIKRKTSSEDWMMSNSGSIICHDSLYTYGISMDSNKVRFFRRCLSTSANYFDIKATDGKVYDLDSVDTDLTGKMYHDIPNTEEDMTWDSFRSLCRSDSNKGALKVIKLNYKTPSEDWMLSYSSSLIFNDGVYLSGLMTTDKIVRIFKRSSSMGPKYFDIKATDGKVYDLDSVDTDLTGKMYIKINNSDYSYTWSDFQKDIETQSGKGSLKFITIEYKTASEDWMLPYSGSIIYNDYIYTYGISMDSNKVRFFRRSMSSTPRYFDLKATDGNVYDLDSMSKDSSTEYFNWSESSAVKYTNRFVTIKEGAIRLAKSDDDYILGINIKNTNDEAQGIVKLLGLVSVTDDGTCVEDGYCYPNEYGIATSCDNISKGFKVVKRKNIDTVEIILK